MGSINIVMIFSGPTIYEAAALRELVFNKNQEVYIIYQIVLNKSLCLVP